MQIYTIQLLMIFVTLVSCSDQDIEKYCSVIIDNPTDQEIIVKFDLETLSIPSKSYIKKSVKTGNHELKHKSLDTLFSIESQIEFLINPTLNPYFKEEVIFSDKAQQMAANLSNVKMKYFPINVLTIEDSINLIGPFKEIKDELFIKDYDYGINRGSDIVIKSKHESEIHKIKLYRYDQFLKEMASVSPNLQKKVQKEKLNINPIAEVKKKGKIDFFKKRDEVVQKEISNINRYSDFKVAIVEINIDNEFSTLISRTDSIIIFLSSKGTMESKNVNSDSWLSDEDLKLTQNFISNSHAFITNDEKAENFEQIKLPKKGDIKFHILTTESKNTITLKHDELIKNSMKSTYTTPYDMLYSQSFKIISMFN